MCVHTLEAGLGVHTRQLRRASSVDEGPVHEEKKG